MLLSYEIFGFSIKRRAVTGNIGAQTIPSSGKQFRGTCSSEVDVVHQFLLFVMDTFDHALPITPRARPKWPARQRDSR